MRMNIHALKGRGAGLLLSVAVGAALTWTAATSGHDGVSVSKIKMILNPSYASWTPTAANSKGTPANQAGEEWDGTAPIPDPAAVLGISDTREFSVLADPGTAQVMATITWTAGPPGMDVPSTGVLYDLDLYIDKLSATGSWEQVASSTNGQALGEGDVTEIAVVASAPPGTYRTRVVNWASTDVFYHGVLGFTTLATPKGKKRAGGGGSGSAGRATADRPDAVSGAQLHLIYMTTADGADLALDTNGVIDNSVASINQFFERETGGRRMRLDTYLSGGTPLLDISYVRGNQTTAEYVATGAVFETITDELEARGWTADPAQKRYVVYFEGPAEDPNVCGTAYANTLGTSYAQWSVVFLGADPGCGARDFGSAALGGGMSESIVVQEMLHNEALARPESLHHCAAAPLHICTAAAGALTEIVGPLDPERIDVLFPYVTVPLRDKVVDRDHDDYYEQPFPTRNFANSVFWE